MLATLLLLILIALLWPDAAKFILKAALVAFILLLLISAVSSG